MQEPPPSTNGIATFGCIPQFTFYCSLKNSSQATTHCANFGHLFFHIGCCLSRCVPLTDLKVTSYFLFATLSTWASLMSHLSLHLSSSQPGPQAARNSPKTDGRKERKPFLVSGAKRWFQERKSGGTPSPRECLYPYLCTSMITVPC